MMAVDKKCDTLKEFILSSLNEIIRGLKPRDSAFAASCHSVIAMACRVQPQVEAESRLS
jgi:hypothetical protein